MQAPERFAADLLRRSSRALAAAATHTLAPSDSGGRLVLPEGFADPVDDNQSRLLALAESLDVDRPALLADHTAWYKVAFAHRHVDPEYLPRSLQAIRQVLRQELPTPCHAAVDRHVDLACQTAAEAPTELPSHLEGDGPWLDEARRYLLAALENRRHDALDIIVAAHARGASVSDLHDHVLARIQREVGRMWLMAEIPIADEHYVSRLVESSLERLSSLSPRAPRRGQVVLTCMVGGDQHSIGVRMIAERFEMHGFDAWNLGADMPVGDFDWLLQDRRVDLIALGGTLLLHVSKVRATIARLRAVLGAACPPILVGGGPFARVADLYRIVGADAAAGDAPTAVARGIELLQARSPR